MYFHDEFNIVTSEVHLHRPRAWLKNIYNIFTIILYNIIYLYILKPDIITT